MGWGARGDNRQVVVGGPSARAVAAALQCLGGDENSGVSGAGSAEGAAAGEVV